jgi:acetoin utilization deacetylase AcuC-like enzyme
MKKMIYVLLLALLGTAACNKKEVAPLHFQVTVSGYSFRAGDTVQFVFTGNPDLITFYSGEDGHRYDHRHDLDSTGDALSDVGSALKDMTTRLDTYQYVYAQPGSYTATFEAANKNIYGSRTMVRTVNLTITP